jgi:hypothetical protein
MVPSDFSARLAVSRTRGHPGVRLASASYTVRTREIEFICESHYLIMDQGYTTAHSSLIFPKMIMKMPFWEELLAT